MKQGYIYAIRSQYPRLIKIGFSKSPETRLAELQTGSPQKLTLLDKWKGTLDHEHEIHRRLKPHHAHGEWFKIQSEEAESAISRVTGSASESATSHLDASLAIFLRAFDQFLEAGGLARLHQMPQSTILAIEIHGVVKCHNCEAWTTLMICPGCGNPTA